MRYSVVLVQNTPKQRIFNLTKVAVVFVAPFPQVNEILYFSTYKSLMTRYHEYWIPLLAEVSSDSTTDLLYAPPLDVRYSKPFKYYGYFYKYINFGGANIL
jgi:hypothetical protein